MTTYTCAKCQAPATVSGGVVLRTCTCAAGVVAHLSAVTRGASRVSG
jgi:hypothetical protein